TPLARKVGTWAFVALFNTLLFSPTPVARKVGTWAFVALFNTLLFSPVLFHLMNPTLSPAVANFGVGLAWVGLTLELSADTTKAARVGLAWVGLTLESWADTTKVGLAWVGLTLESSADTTKSAFKAKRPDSFCTVGLYAL
ncbi:hypothetical protein T484DRAFT_1790447, partial [Baffinella frigidus]